MIDGIDELDEGQNEQSVSTEQQLELDIESAPTSLVSTNLGLPASWRAGEGSVRQEEVATKVDDAEVPIYLWNEVLLEDMNREISFTCEEEQALETLRIMVLCQWRYRLTRCFCRWIRCSECAFMESDELFKVYPIELPEPRRA